jgi:hypothetical protein
VTAVGIGAVAAHRAIREAVVRRVARFLEDEELFLCRVVAPDLRAAAVEESLDLLLDNEKKWVHRHELEKRDNLFVD